MYREYTVGVVVPAYNEAAFVGEVVEGLPSFVDEIYLVDDASTDGTWAAMGDAMAARAGGKRPAASASERWDSRLESRVTDAETAGGVTRFRHVENRGAGGAVKTGYFAGIADGVDVIATIDGDGQMDPDRLPEILDPVVAGRAEYAKGNRFAETSVVREMPPVRLFGNLLLTGLTRVASGYWGLEDPQNGYTAILTHTLTEIGADGLPEYYGYMNQLVARLNTVDARIADVEMPTTYGSEESGIVHHEYVYRVSGLLLLAFVRRLWANYADGRSRPAVAGYAGSALVALTAVVAGLRSIADGESHTERATTAGGLAVSTTLFVAAVLSEKGAAPRLIDREPTEEPAAGQQTGDTDAER